LHPSFYQVLAFLLALAFAWLLRFFWGYWLALLAFWATQANALLGIQDALIFLLAGQVFGVLIVAITKLSQTLTLAHVTTFLIALLAGVLILYAILLFFASCVFWSPGFLFTWVFDGIFQMARYPLGLYPGWARLILTWIIPVGVMTTVPAQALTGDIPFITLAGTVAIAIVLVIVASVLFQTGLRRYASASS
jgi:ABC-2 type transport system permease protein